MLIDILKGSADLVCMIGSMALVGGLAKNNRTGNRFLDGVGSAASVVIGGMLGFKTAEMADSAIDSVTDILKSAADGVRKAGDAHGADEKQPEQ